MPRIRTIKPDFCTSADTGALSRDARLFFVQLLTDVDDEGRCIYIPKRIAGALYPFDDDVGAAEITLWVKECVARSMLEVYEVAGRRYLRVVNFGQHQRVNHPSPSRLPPPPEDFGGFLEFPEGFPPEVEVEMEQGTGNREVERAPEGYAASFDDFYAAYPRKVAKDAARKAWDKAIRRTPPGRILAGAERFASDPNLPEKQFVPYPATWLNAGSWDDEPQPPRTNGRGPSRMNRTLTNLASALEEDHEQAGDRRGTGEARRGLPPGGGT